MRFLLAITGCCLSLSLTSQSPSDSLRIAYHESTSRSKPLVCERLYVQGKLYDTWDYDSNGEVVVWQHHDYAGGKLQKSAAYLFQNGDTALLSVNLYNEREQLVSMESYNTGNSLRKFRSEWQYDSLDNLLWEKRYFSDSTDRLWLCFRDSLDYPHPDKIVHHWKIMEDAPFSRSAAWPLPYDSVVVERDKKGNIISRKSYHILPEIDINGSILTLHSQEEKIRCTAGGKIKRVYAYTGNQVMRTRNTYYANGQLRYSVWKERPHRWKQSARYNPTGALITVMRREEGKTRYRWRGKRFRTTHKNRRFAP